MEKQIFISYASANQGRAEEVCSFLETRGWTCWIAPRNVQAGRDYGEQIISAIESSKLMILILTRDANSSAFVKNEVERAFSKRKIIVTFRVEDVSPSRAIELFVGSAHWIEAWNPPWVHRLELLARTVAEFAEPAVIVKRPEVAQPIRMDSSAPIDSSSFVIHEKSGTQHELSELSMDYPSGFGPARMKRGIRLRRGSAETLVEWNRIDTITFLSEGKAKDRNHCYDVQVLLHDGKSLALELAIPPHIGGAYDYLYGQCDLGEVGIRFSDIRKITCPRTKGESA